MRRAGPKVRPTWNSVSRQHDCCGSRQVAHHCKGCAHYVVVDHRPNKYVIPPPPVVVKIPAFTLRVRALRDAGLNSLQAAAKLHVPLEKINAAWA